MSDFFQDQAYKPSPQKTDDVLGFLAGAGNQALFGIPEAVVRQFGDKKTIDDWIEANKGSYGAGEVAGSIGSAFIPVVGLAGKAVSGAGKLAKAGSGLAKTAEKVGGGLDKLQKVKSGAGLIGKGVAEGLIGQGIRSTAENDQDAIQNLALAGGLGAAGGALGGALSKMKFGVEEMGENAAKGTIATALETPARVLANWIKGMTPGSLSKKLENITPKIDEAASMVSGKNSAGISLIPSADKPEKAFEWYQVVKNGLEEMEQKYIQNPDVVDEGLFKSFDDILSDVSKEVRGDVTGFGGLKSDVVKKEAGELLLGAMDMPTLIDKRVYFNNLMDRSYMGMKNGDPYKAVQYMTAVRAKGALNEAISDFADSLGESGQQYKQLLKEYGVLEGLVAPSLFRAETKVGSGSGGSNTAEKLASQLGVQKILAGEEVPLEGFASLIGGHVVGKALNTAVPYVADRLGATTYKGLKGLGESKTFQGVADVGEKYAGQVTSPLARAQAGTMIEENPVEPQVSEEPKEGPFIPEENKRHVDLIAGGDPERFNERIITGIANGFNKITQGAFGAPSMENPQFVEFLQSVESELVDENGNYKPEIIANIVFDKPEERKKYISTIKALANIETGQQAASETSGMMGSIKSLLGTADPTKVAQKQTLMGSIQDVGKLAGASDKEVEKLVDSILSSGSSDKEKKQKLMQVLAQYNPKVGTNV